MICFIFQESITPEVVLGSPEVNTGGVSSTAAHLPGVTASISNTDQHIATSTNKQYWFPVKVSGEQVIHVLITQVPQVKNKNLKATNTGSQRAAHVCYELFQF